MNAKTRAELDALAKFDNYIDWEKFIAWLDAPEPADPRTAEEKAADAKVCRVYSKNAAKRYMQREKWLRSMLHCQMEAIANLPLELRASALVFDPILPPVHPRIGPPREYPIAAKIRVRSSFILIIHLDHSTVHIIPRYVSSNDSHVPSSCRTILTRTRTRTFRADA